MLGSSTWCLRRSLAGSKVILGQSTVLLFTPMERGIFCSGIICLLRLMFSACAGWVFVMTGPAVKHICSHRPHILQFCARFLVIVDAFRLPLAGKMSRNSPPKKKKREVQGREQHEPEQGREQHKSEQGREQHKSQL